MNPPRATMRLQFHKGFTFDDAVRQVSYLAALDVSHLYASPIMTARAGSMHGYDVVDPTRVNPELGGEQAFRRLVGALRHAGLGMIVDIVPNHMAVGGGDNTWWLDVLQYGAASRYAKFFDIDWEPEDAGLRGKVLVPLLGRPYGDALAQGEISLAFNAAADRFEARYFHHVFPIAPEDRAEIERQSLPAFDAKVADGRGRLHALLERQHFRLAWWHTANDEINWRRFFDINELAGLRVEDDEVFEATHATLFRLFGEGLIDGVRVDHVDGLSDPGGYCRQLRSRLDALAKERPPAGPAGPPYLVVEKILGAGEQLSTDWDCDGTSGYDFMDAVSSVLHDPAGEEPLGLLWACVSGRPKDFAVEEDASRREILDRSFSSQVAAAVAALHQLARADLATRDISRPAIRRALIEILVHMRVYRTYAGVGGQAPAGQGHLARAVQGAERTCLRGDRDVVDRLAFWLAGGSVFAGARELQAAAIKKFQQLSAPLAAKAVEDTAFYRYGRLLSRVDVGFDAENFAADVAAFHQISHARRERFPDAMLATATHDHKRGEDVRTRLAVLSEIAGEWAAKLQQWIERSARLREPLDGKPAPSPGDVAILLQMIIGAWPPNLSAEDRNGLAVFAERLAGWQFKALREAKLATDWTAPNEAYEAAATQFFAALARWRADRSADRHRRFCAAYRASGRDQRIGADIAKADRPRCPRHLSRHGFLGFEPGRSRQSPSRRFSGETGCAVRAGADHGAGAQLAQRARQTSRDPTRPRGAPSSARTVRSGRLYAARGRGAGVRSRHRLRPAAEWRGRADRRVPPADAIARRQRRDRHTGVSLGCHAAEPPARAGRNEIVRCNSRG